MRLLDPKLDIVFKLLLTRHPGLLGEMLSAVLGERLSSLEVLNPSIPGDIGSDKTIVLDILVALADGRRVDVEMQIKVTDELAPRLVYYCAKEHAEHIKRGQSYRDVRPTIVVAWLAQPLFPELKQLHSVFELRERKTHQLFSEDFAVHILQLSEMKRTPGDHESESEQKVRKWARFLGANTEEEFRRLSGEDETMAEAVHALEELSEDAQARRMAEDRANSLKFYELGLARSEAKGRRAGRVEGLAEGQRVALQESIRRLCNKLGIELTESREQQLAATSTDLEALHDTVALERRWPE